MLNTSKVILVLSALIGWTPLTIAISDPLYVIGLWILWTRDDIDREDKIAWSVLPLILIALLWATILFLSFLQEIIE